MDIVTKILENDQKKSKYKPIAVEKHLDLQYDLGTLLSIDTNDIDVKELKSNKDTYLQSLTRDNIQLLLNQVWELPTDRVDEAIVVQLPQPTTTLPRSKPVPKPRPLTKWQEFAKAKGITKKKKDKLSWDEELQKWVPLYGYKRTAAEKEKNWLIEVPQNVDPMTDMYERKASQKSEKVAKNELQRLKNIARAKKIKIPRVGLPVTSDKATANQLATAATVARSSTASIGKFQDRLPKEKDARGKGVNELVPGSDRKRKAPLPDIASEKQNNLNMLDNILKKKPRINIENSVEKKDIPQTPQKTKSKKKTPKKQFAKKQFGKKQKGKK